MSAPKVFISYSHDSPEHSERVFSLAWALRNNGIDVELDQFHNDEIVDWPRWCNEQTSREHSDFVVCVCTAEYKRRLDGHVPPEKGKGVYWEGSLLDDDVYDEKGNSRLIPILFDDEAELSIPRFLRGWTHCRLRQFTLNDAGYEHLIRILTGQASVEKNPLGRVPVLPAKRPATEPQSKADFKADISRIIDYAPAELVGREAELKILSDAWQQAVHGEPQRPHILTFVALGGEGKTSLVAKWAADLAYQGWPGCDVAFAWSFYSQGTSEKTQASSDTFLAEALRFFGDDETAASARSAYEKGRRLAHLVGEKRALLILDGVEPLQYPPGPPMDGKLKDEGIAALHKALATMNRSLCVVTTRYSIPDLRAFWQTTAPEVKLQRLSSEAGTHLLKTLGVRGTEKEFEQLVADVKGHALTLNLLGTYLRDAHGGDIRKRDLVRLSEADAEEQGGHAFRVMEAYERVFEAEGDSGGRALAILRLLGLFDRPMSYECFGSLLQEPVIGVLTEPLMGFTEGQLNIALSRLRSAKLITVNRDSSGALISIDAHPLLREYFAKQLKEKNLDGWRAAHRRLYEYLRDSTVEGEEPKLEDLQPLYQAVFHGCQAGLLQEACRDIYFARVLQGNRHYSWKRLGSYGSDLAVIANFFEPPWSQVSPSLSEVWQLWVTAQAGLYLRAIGRLTEAVNLMRAALETGLKTSELSNDEQLRAHQVRQAAIRASNLSEMELVLGDVDTAVLHAEQSVTYAESTGNAFRKTTSHCRTADTLHQRGRRSEAGARFREAEEMHIKDHAKHPLLFSLRGFQYCDLLLSAPERAAWQLVLNSSLKTHHSSLADSCRVVFERATQTLEWARDSKLSPLSIALDHLTLGRAALYALILDPSSASNRLSAIENIGAAVDGLRRAGTAHHLPRGLLTRSWLRLLKNDRDGARTDLDEAWEISERGPMRLYMADIHLYRARLFHAVTPYPWNKFADGSEGRGPKDDLNDARKLIEQSGYWRRKEELEDAEEAAKNWT